MKFDYWFLQIIRTYFVVPKLCQKTFYWKLKKKIIEVKDFQEHTWCKIEMSNKTFLHMLCLYRSPSSSSENNKLLSELILNISLIWGKLLVPGDFNYPTINWDNLSTPNLSNFCTFKFLAATQDAYYSSMFRTIHILDLIKNQLWLTYFFRKMTKRLQTWLLLHL